MESLLLFRRALASPTMCRFIPALSVPLSPPFGFLIHQPFPDGGAVFAHVGADAGLGFGIGGGVGIETDRFCGAAVIHGSRPDQVSKGDFLMGGGIADRIFWH